MRRALAIALSIVPMVLLAQAPAAPRPSLAEPGISPDASTIAFVSGGDIWEVPARGGDARLLVSHPAAESRPMYSPDGSRLAFTSARTGNGDVYVLTLATGELVRLTFDDAAELMNGWSRDGTWVYFSSGSHDLSSMADIYRVAATGGTPMAVAADRYATEYFAAPSPDGATLAITARGFAGSQWWRKGHSHLDESEIWLVRPSNGTPKYERVTLGGAKDVWPMWSADGKSLYFMSDRSGAQNIWTVEVAEDRPAKVVTAFRDGRVLWPTISRDGRTIAFERNFGIWTLDTGSRRAVEVPVVLRGAPAAVSAEHRTFTDQMQDLALSPDGRKIAFAAHGNIFSASAKDGGDAVRLTSTPAEEFGPVWAPDSRRLVYGSDRDGVDHLFLFDVVAGKETPLSSGSVRDQAPVFSPDGRWLAFQRDNRELRVRDVDTKQDRLVATGLLYAPRTGQPSEFAWSPDSKYLAYVATDQRGFQNLYVASAIPDPADAAATKPSGRPVSFLANINGGSIAWSPDGTFLTFVSSQRTEPGRVVRVDLIPQTPKFREDQFRDLFREQTPRPSPQPPPAPAEAAPPAAPEPAAGPSPRRPASVTIDFTDIRRRASLIPAGLDVTQQIISPDGKSLLLVASAAGQENLYSYSIDELSREPAVVRQLTSTPGSKSRPQFTSDSKEVLYLDRGRIFNVTLERREPKAIAVTAEMDIDFAREKTEVFQQAWRFLKERFFDEHMNGVDWEGVRAAYEPHAAGAATGDELRRVISLMLGELNASHMGIAAPAQTTQTTLGRLVVDFDRAEYEANGRLKVVSVVPLGPAALGGIKAGDYVVSVDSRPIGPNVKLDQLLDHTIGRRIALSVASGSPTAAAREVVVKPVNQTTEKGLRYRAWAEERRDYVRRASGGRLGYAHMYDMSETALNQLHVDLDTENQAREGVVIDVRNNNGGFVNVYAIDVLARRGYFNMARRDLPVPPISSRTMLGQRALERPTILVTSQHSLSDAEDFTEGYRSLKLGKVVGEPTAGWIIYTGSVSLIDGSTLRMPGTKIFASDGTPMEMHPRPVDVPVVRPMGESYTTKDVQLDTAVAELLKQIDAAKGRRPRPGS